MRRIAALTAVVAVLLLSGPLTATAEVPLQVPAPGGLELDLDGLSPRVVTVDGPTVVTITGVLRNTGDAAVSDIGIRLQRGEALDDEGEVRDALDGEAPTDAISPRFQDLPDVLAAGGETPVRLTVPLRGAPETTLALSEPGVYELLVNVNGVPEGGDRARLAAVRMLLPVLGLPAGTDGARPVAGETPDGPPAQLSMIYPVVDVPRRLSTVPGEPTLLSDDELAAAFGPEGRLTGLVEALATAAPVGSSVREGVCVAVDPDLLQTASRMSAGYQVLLPDGSRADGVGAAAAGAWLARLSDVLDGGCVVALPFADADVVALTRSGLGAEATSAVVDGREIASGLLTTPVLPATALPADGVVDEATLTTLADGGVRSLVLSADGVELPTSSTYAGVVRIGGSRPLTAVLADPLLAIAADAGRDVLSTPTTTVNRRSGEAAGSVPAVGPLGTQDALGTLAFRLTEDLPDVGPVLLSPSRRWPADAVSARTLLEGVGRFVDAGLAEPVGLDEAAAAAPSDPEPTEVEYPLAARAQEVAVAGSDAARAAGAQIADLRSSVVDDERGVDTSEVFAELVQGTVRPVSSAWRGRPDLAESSSTLMAERIEAVRGTLRVLEPPGPFALGSSSSPLLLTVTNGLPVTMRVRVELASGAGLMVAPIPEVEIPPLGRRQVTVEAEVVRSGVFTVTAAVLSRQGEQLGPASRLQVRSTAYGTITVWLTGTAAVLLVVLVARRIMKRARRRTDVRSSPQQPTPQDQTPQELTAPMPRSTAEPIPTSPQTSPPTSPRTSQPPIPDSRSRPPLLPTSRPGTQPGPASNGRPPSNAPSPDGLPTGPPPPAPWSRTSVDGSASPAGHDHADVRETAPAPAAVPPDGWTTVPPPTRHRRPDSGPDRSPGSP